MKIDNASVLAHPGAPCTIVPGLFAAAPAASTEASDPLRAVASGAGLDVVGEVEPATGRIDLLASLGF